MTVLNLSFAACGFLGIYQLGAVGALLRHGEKLLATVKACAGASAGALHCKEFTYKFADNVRRQRLGAMTPGYDFMLELREGIEEVLPPNAHQVANEHLHISITHSRTGRNHMVSSFASREDLIKVLLASSFVPIYAGIRSVEFQGQKWIDGGFTDSLPVFPVGRTVTISPFSGSQDVCPRHTGRSNLQLKVANMTVNVSKENLIRFNQALFPPSLHRMKMFHHEGYEDALQFLRREKWTD
ncbi:patatin-like phospholipase domain-containing protein 4 isoform X2 [Denticeps clupeoides]|uniref:patatin-like phospholipase domain-containing protein 4 isoform X2 n=1 Tax=Denticeps clupeoides TaxID=299321 RepID=UPI0010A3923B|nr:patatin-like phospholipase domain-containing protein 4 isoform X2 [Denticeps clupeoides]